ncbi:hypothetical protein ABZ896_12420 [Streptomyces sp. NPDC047072]|uniref:hypothetical protein n=1 Tax=Streptomyces sp. NPDC047072 TaxID=3154809 RepID=UPI0033EDEC95
MPWDSHVLSLPAPLPRTTDPSANIIAAALTEIEDQLGERQGWDRPSRLFTLRLLPGGQVEAAFTPERVDALQRRACALPPVPGLIQPSDPAQASVAAVGFIFEGWNRQAHAELPPHLMVLRRMGVRVNHLLPDSQEVRVVHAVDLNQRAFHVMRTRGKQPRVGIAGQRCDAPNATGTVPSALARLMHAARRSDGVIPGHSL